MRLRAWLIVVSLALTAGVAQSDNCDAFPPPTDFAVSIKPGIGAGADYVDITWTVNASEPPPPGVNFGNYVIQRRDDTAGGAFAPVITSTFRFAREYTQGIANPEQSPSCSFSSGCVEPGHTYTYRVIVQFTYAVGCPLHDGKVHDSAPSAEVRLVVPGGAATGDGVPRNVVACAETKTSRVHVYWDSEPTGDKPKHVVQRRKIPSAKSATRDEPSWATIATVANKVLEYTDRTAEADELYAYRVGALLAEDAKYSAEDQAHPQGKICRTKALEFWTGKWQASAGGEHYFDVEFEPSDGLTFGMDEFDPDVRVFSAAGKAPRVFNGRPAWKWPITLSEDHRTTSWPEWLKEESKGQFAVTLVEPAGAFDSDAWIKATAFITFKTKGARYERQLDLRRTDAPVTGAPAGAKGINTTLCFSVTAGASKVSDSKPGAYAPVKPGQKVVFLFQCVAKGPSPLLPRHAAITVQLENGVIQNVLPLDAVELIGDPDGTKRADLDLGALGPDRSGRSEVAAFAMTAVVTEGEPGRQLNATFTLTPGPNYAPASESLSFDEPVRVVELPIR